MQRKGDEQYIADCSRKYEIDVGMDLPDATKGNMLLRQASLAVLPGGHMVGRQEASAALSRPSRSLTSASSHSRAAVLGRPGGLEHCV